MSSAGISVFVFGVYLVINGLIFTFMPNTPLGLLGMPATQEPWIRVMGWLMVLIGYYYIQTGRNNISQFFNWTVQARISVFLIFLLFFFLNWAPATILIFGAIDLIGAIWTLVTNRSK